MMINSIEFKFGSFGAGNINLVLMSVVIVYHSERMDTMEWSKPLPAMLGKVPGEPTRVSQVTHPT
jgi:hypothetical protein